MNYEQKNNFNTSHVTVYLFRHAAVVRLPQFQYISCYCLSTEDIDADYSIEFQYISCYCLSS